jgi:hypothetical protein
MTHPAPAQGRQLGVTFLAWLNIYQNLKQAMQDVVAPEIQALRGDIKQQNGEIKALSVEIAGVRQQLHLFEKSVDARLDALSKRVDDLACEWRQSLDIRERLAVLEARLGKR